jgi:hypothetical protein
LDSTTLDPFSSIAAAAQKLAASERVGGLCRYSISYACSGIGIVGSFTEMQGNGLLRTRKGSWTAQLWWILSSSILAAAELALHLRRVGGLCRYSISYACSGIGIVGSYHRNAGQRAAQVNTEGLGRYNFGGSFRVVY